MGTWLGFDFGTRRIGVAVGQTVTGTATPVGTLTAVARRPDWERIGALIRDWRPEGLVVGLPFNMDDTEAEVAPRARRFARQLHGRFRLPVHLVDERLTSLEAERRLAAEGRHAGDLDAEAAKLILETWLSERDTRDPDG
jgi:putative Holliday junction resolvase